MRVVNFLLMLLLAGPGGAQEVTVPNFWDPTVRQERPDAAEIGSIRFLTSEDFPPFNFRDRRGMLIGFNVDLARAICAVLKVECLIQYRPFETLRTALLRGEGDAVIAGLARTEDEEGLLFTRAYLKIPARFVARSDASFDPAAAGFAGTVCGSAHQAYLGDHFNELIAPCYSSLSIALGELKAGRLDAVFADALRLSFWLHGRDSEECCAFVSGPYLDDRYFGAGLAIAVRPGERELRAALDYGLREIYRQGTYEELYLRYFPVSLY
ncbi:MAG TPA: transporter substrate-binding domain-containing protein [Afifellaceae bacterium]|nr:transporter substrate-binding domain-containing protein [Afifellaceae bacterium]